MKKNEAILLVLPFITFLLCACNQDDPIKNPYSVFQKEYRTHGEEYEDEYEQEDYLRNFTSGSGQSRGKRERSIFDEIEDAFDEDEEDDEEPYAVYVEEKRNIFGKRKVITEKKDDNRKLKIMILLEIIALLCVAIWWVVMQL